MRIAWWTLKATECVTLISYPQQKWSKRPSKLRYTYIACLVLGTRCCLCSYYRVLNGKFVTNQSWPLIRRLVAGLSLLRMGVSPRSVHVRFAVDKLAQWLSDSFLFKSFDFTLSESLCQSFILILNTQQLFQSNTALCYCHPMLRVSFNQHM